MIALAFILVTALAVIVVALVLYTTRQHINTIEAAHSYERLRWLDERVAWQDERRWLNDRMIARHAGDVVAMDNAAARREQPAEPRQERERLGAMPEGLTG